MNEQECPRGVCLKWTYYVGGTLWIERTCSARLDFNIMMIDGVCRTESKGNGDLCMCGKHLCNSGHDLHKINTTNLFLLSVSLVITQHLWSLWER
ncbi:hypothetical protein KUTeg_014841 [Tegillarca granosa]|uniref:Protein quiver n=1 Tax=Tegillarca granosa TaxID=220873 RepID=A0ABQ9EUH7_TEGGR|nr:hypothetical protein KUTeg_014841 [Tegillarca granosa]